MTASRHQARGGQDSLGRAAQVGAWMDRHVGRRVPDPLVLALALSGIVLVLAAARLLLQGEPLIAATGCTEAACQGVLRRLAVGWATGASGAGGLAFALQMCLILVTGHALATSPPVAALVRRLARWPRHAPTATALVAVVSCLAALVHWGLGAIVGALLARQIGREAEQRGTPIHYPLLGAAAYTGLAVWHGGLSGSAPLKVAEANHFLVETVGVIPVSQTIFGGLNLVVTGGLLVTIPALLYWLTPTQGAPHRPSAASPAAASPAAAAGDAPARVDVGTTTLADRALAWGFGSLIVVVFGWGVFTGALAFDINAVNLTFLGLGLALHGSCLSYARAAVAGATGAAAVIVQFPLYFGIVGLMGAGGLIASFSNALVGVSTSNTFPAVAFLAAGAVNLVVPSGGGQWAVQGEILLTTAERLGVDPISAVMAFSYGDAWTNMLQPFWALPLLGAMGLQAKDIIGYTAVVGLWMGVWTIGCLFVLG